MHQLYELLSFVLIVVPILTGFSHTVVGTEWKLNVALVPYMELLKEEQKNFTGLEVEAGFSWSEPHFIANSPVSKLDFNQQVHIIFDNTVHANHICDWKRQIFSMFMRQSKQIQH